MSLVFYCTVCCDIICTIRTGGSFRPGAAGGVLFSASILSYLLFLLVCTNHTPCDIWHERICFAADTGPFDTNHQQVNQTASPTKSYLPRLEHICVQC